MRTMYVYTNDDGNGISLLFVFVFIADRYLNGMDGNTDTIVIYDENTSKHKEREDTDNNERIVITYRLSINLNKIKYNN